MTPDLKPAAHGLKPCPWCEKQPVTHFMDGQAVGSEPLLCRCLNSKCPLIGKVFTVADWQSRPLLSPPRAGMTEAEIRQVISLDVPLWDVVNEFRGDVEQRMKAVPKITDAILALVRRLLMEPIQGPRQTNLCECGAMPVIFQKEKATGKEGWGYSCNCGRYMEGYSTADAARKAAISAPQPPEKQP